MILMQRNINIFLLTAEDGFPDKDKPFIQHKKRGESFYTSIPCLRTSGTSSVSCGYRPIEKGLIVEVKRDQTINILSKYSKRIRTRVYHNIIEFLFLNFAKEDEGVIQCLMKPNNHLSKELHLIFTGECIYLLICPFKYALAGTMCL